MFFGLAREPVALGLGHLVVGRDAILAGLVFFPGHGVRRRRESHAEGQRGGESSDPVERRHIALRPLMRRRRIAMTAITSRTCISPPRVTDVMSPRSHRM